MGSFLLVPVRPASAMLFALVLFCVAFAAAQVPRPCQSPTQWEGRIYRSDESKNFTQFAKISYDEQGKRVREIEELEFGSDREFYDVIYLHNENKEYRLELKSRKCNVSTISRPFIPAGIPVEGRYVGEAVVGPVNIANEHVTVVTYDGKFSDGADFYGSVSYPDCCPSPAATTATGLASSTPLSTTSLPGSPTPPCSCPPRSAWAPAAKRPSLLSLIYCVL